MIFKKNRMSNRAFALAASTMMTAVSVSLAAAMLTARGQWQLYAAKSSEKIILETAATAETQDFMNRVRLRLDNLEGSSAEEAGVLSSNELFSSNPFRRVKLRGGVARVVGGDQAPLLFREMEQDGLAGATSQQINSSSSTPAQAIIIPALWVPGNSNDPAKNPSRLPLGKDDPFYEINCRTSFAALSAYSPSRNPNSSASSKSGFGNVIVTQTRTFPVSAFTYFDFDPESELKIDVSRNPLSIGGNSSSPPSLDLGRIYTAGSVIVDTALPWSASQIVALGGVDSTIPALSENPGSETHLTEADYEAELSLLAQQEQQMVDQKLSELELKIQEEYNGDRNSSQAKIATMRASEELARIRYQTALAKKRLLSRKLITQASPVAESSSAPILAPLSDEANATLMSESSSIRHSPQGSGNRVFGRKINFDLSKRFEESPDLVAVPSAGLGSTFKNERIKTLRGAVVTEDNGGTKLIRNNAINSLSSLVEETERFADCRVRFSLSPPDPLTGLRHPVVADDGIRLRADTQKPLIASSIWVGEGEESGAPFYWIRGENNSAGGLLVFDPSRLAFSPALGSSSKTKPFAIFLDTSALDLEQLRPAKWYFGVSSSSPTEGISIISPQRLYVFGNFITDGTYDPTALSRPLPSMIISPAIYATHPLSSFSDNASPPSLGTSTTIDATLITAAPNATKLLRKADWLESGREAYHPRSPQLVVVRGSSVAWDSSPLNQSQYIDTLAVVDDISSSRYLTAEVAPALVPVVAEVRVSASAPTNKKIGFLRPEGAPPDS
jgi:hypothetical protein